MIRPPALAVMARAPGSERVKSRLHAALGVGPATLLYRCFLLDGLEAAAAVPGLAPVLAFSPPHAERAMAALAPAGMRLVAQAAGDLGARMARLVVELLADGHRAALLIGSDLPTLPAAHLIEASRALAEDAADVCWDRRRTAATISSGSRGRRPRCSKASRGARAAYWRRRAPGLAGSGSGSICSPRGTTWTRPPTSTDCAAT